MANDMLVKLFDTGTLRLIKVWQADRVSFEPGGWLKVYGRYGIIYTVGAHLTSVTSSADTVYIELKEQ